MTSRALIVPKFAFQFIAGKYEGGSFVIPDDQEMYIGRATDVEVVLIEDMVSRRHAQLSSYNGRLILRDLGSTNGTFVNGERIEACELELQDRVLVGTSMLRVVSHEQVAGQTVEINMSAAAEASEGHAGSTGRPKGVQEGLPLQGSLAQFPLETLLRGYAAAQEVGRLDLHLGDDRITLVLDKGSLVHASMASDERVSPLNALRHALSWPEGDFQLTRSAQGPAVPQSFTQDTETTLALALRQNEAAKQSYEQRWRDAPQVSFKQPLGAALRTLSPEELDAVQLVLEWHTIEAILEHAHHDDCALLGHLDALVQRGVLLSSP